MKVLFIALFFTSCSITRLDSKSQAGSGLVQENSVQKKSFPDILINDGNISKDLIRSSLEKYSVEIQNCYEKRLIPRPNLQGLLVIKWAILNNGRVDNVQIEKSQLNDNQIHTCIKSVIRGISFKPASNRGQVSVSYPFSFKSTQL